MSDNEIDSQVELPVASLGQDDCQYSQNLPSPAADNSDESIRRSICTDEAISPSLERAPVHSQMDNLPEQSVSINPQIQIPRLMITSPSSEIDVTSSFDDIISVENDNCSDQMSQSLTSSSSIQNCHQIPHVIIADINSPPSQENGSHLSLHTNASVSLTIEENPNQPRCSSQSHNLQASSSLNDIHPVERNSASSTSEHGGGSHHIPYSTPEPVPWAWPRLSSAPTRIHNIFEHLTNFNTCVQERFSLQENRVRHIK